MLNVQITVPRTFLLLGEFINLFCNFNDFSESFHLFNRLDENRFIFRKLDVHQRTSFEMNIESINEQHTIQITLANAKEVLIKQILVSVKEHLFRAWILLLHDPLNTGIFNDVDIRFEV